MRSALGVGLLVGLAAIASCGDNEPACGNVQLLSANRNIWGGQIAADSERIYYSDYDNGAGAHLVFRQPRDGGEELVVAARDRLSRFGFGMASDADVVYWAAETEPAGYSLLATPLLGGPTTELSAISECTAHGIAVDDTATYAGAIRCNAGVADVPARVIAVPHDGSGTVELWRSADADVSDIAATGGVVFVATSAGLLRVSAAGTELLDGRPSYHAEIAGGDLVYSTDESIIARSLASGEVRTLYAFHTSIDQPRAFAVDGGDLYVAEPPALVFVANGAEPLTIVHDMGAAITQLVARDGSAYWPTLALPGSLGLVGSFSGGVLRVRRPCQ